MDIFILKNIIIEIKYLGLIIILCTLKIIRELEDRLKKIFICNNRKIKWWEIIVKVVRDIYYVKW